MPVSKKLGEKFIGDPSRPNPPLEPYKEIYTSQLMEKIHKLLSITENRKKDLLYATVLNAAVSYEFSKDQFIRNHSSKTDTKKKCDAVIDSLKETENSLLEFCQHGMLANDLGIYPLNRTHIQNIAESNPIASFVFDYKTSGTRYGTLISGLCAIRKIFEEYVEEGDFVQSVSPHLAVRNWISPLKREWSQITDVPFIAGKNYKDSGRANNCIEALAQLMKPLDEVVGKQRIANVIDDINALQKGKS